VSPAVHGFGLVGCGTVGAGVVRLWREPAYADGLALRAVAVRDRRKPRPCDLSGVHVTTDALELARDPQVHAVIELTGDAALGRRLALECFRRRKSFVTAGKELVARFGLELEARARAAGVAFLYEAAACGALPVVALLRLSLSPGNVRGFDGVLNGTCNYVLSRLERGAAYAEALREAQRAGFAERDPGRDTRGEDAAHKLVLLARLCGVRLHAQAVPTSGIEGLRPEDAAFGRRRGWALRLLASFRQTPQGVEAGVAPVFLPRASLLAAARDEENAIALDAGAAGTLTLVGRGAGALPTAAAVLADARQLARGDGCGALAPPRAVASPARPGIGAAPRQYVRLEGSAETARALAAALHAAGTPLDVLACEAPGRVQALTAPAPFDVVRRALLAVPARERVHLVVREEAPGSRREAPAATADREAVA
jgi:homoserine dehydrogenase